MFEQLESRWLMSGSADLLHTSVPTSYQDIGQGVADVNSVVIAVGSMIHDGQIKVVHKFNPQTSDLRISSYKIGPSFAASSYDKGIFAGSFTVSVYNSSNQKWKIYKLNHAWTGKDVPVLGNKVFLRGGDTRDVKIFDAKTEKWSSSLLSQARRVPATAVLDNKVFFAGGYISKTNAGSDRVDIYDASTEKWSTAKLSTPRIHIGAAVVGNLALFAGGSAAGPGEYDTVDIYNFTTGKWSVAHLSERCEVFRPIVAGTKVFFPHNNHSAKVDIYDSITDKWSTIKLFHGSYGISSMALGSKVLISGLSDNNSAALVDIYDTKTGTFSSIAKSELVGSARPIVVGNKGMFFGGDGDNVGSQHIDIYTDNAPTPMLNGILVRAPKHVNLTLHNTGDADLASGFTVNIYATNQRSLDHHPILVGSAVVNNALAPNGTQRIKVAINKPQGMPTGTYNLIATAGHGKHLPAFAIQLGALA